MVFNPPFRTGDNLPPLLRTLLHDAPPPASDEHKLHGIKHKVAFHDHKAVANFLKPAECTTTVSMYLVMGDMK